MSDDSRIRELVEQALDSDLTPEEVCAEYPQILNQVREQLHRCRSVAAQINAMFPPSTAPAMSRRKRLLTGGDPLPQIPGYRVEEVLGRGGVGVVYKAKHLKLNRYVALKMLLSGVYANPHELARFTREAEAVASLRHAHIVQVHDIGELDGLPFFTMEFMEGGSLAHELAGVPLPAKQAASLLEIIASAVHVAHQGGIIHRDLKPSNILLTDDGTAKITDFGLARRIEGDSEMTQTGAHVGTPSYMAPEQALGDLKAIGPSTDVYGLGAVLYEMLTGRPPFRAETASETERQLIFEQPASPSRLNRKVPKDLETICLKCLSKEPSRRYSSAAALADDVRRFHNGEPIKARPVSVAERSRRWSRRHPAAAALCATFLIVAVMTVVGGFWVQRQKSDSRVARARQVQAVEAALAHADDLRKLGHWPEARAALAGAPGLLGTSVPDQLAQRLRRARADVDMVIGLEDVRLQLSEGASAQGKTSPLADRLYCQTFADYGISLTSPDTSAMARLIRASEIRETLLVFLHDWLYWVTEGHRTRLRAIIDAADDDPWRRAFRDARARNDIPMLEVLARTAGADVQPPALLSGLGGALLVDGQRPQAWALLRRAQQHHPSDFYLNYLLGRLLERDSPQEAIGYLRAAIAIRPTSDQAYTLLGRALRQAGDDEGSMAALQKLKTNPNRDTLIELSALLAPKGRLEEVRAAWEKMLSRDPADLDSWYGYAQLCLFLGKEDEYRRARDSMLRRFGRTDDWIVAERTALASLLLSSSGDDLQRATALVDRAVANAKKSPEPDNPYVTFLKGLSEFRQGHMEQALPILREASARLPDRPGPRLVLAMAQFRSGSPSEARQMLADAIVGYDWKEPHDDHPTVWVSHVLRREAEAMILPNLTDFLQGRHQPQDNDERLALLGICQSQGLDAMAAQLYVDAFAADPDLARRLTVDCLNRASHEKESHNRIEILKTAPRYLAARCAASAGCGRSHDRPALTAAQRLRWRNQTLQWLREDLQGSTKSLEDRRETASDLSTKMLTLWQADSELAGLREPDALNKLPAEEGEKWAALWKQIAEVLARSQRFDH